MSRSGSTAQHVAVYSTLKKESEAVGEAATLEGQLEQEYGFTSSPDGSAAEKLRWLF
jgi:hypothetical protein